MSQLRVNGARDDVLNFNKIFEDTQTEQLRKQIRELQTYFHKELDKSITKQLIVAVLDRGLLPVVEYPDTITPNAMPMTYSRKYDYSINAHVPIPTLKLYREDEWIKPSSLEQEKEQRQNFQELLKSTKELAEKYGKL